MFWEGVGMERLLSIKINGTNSCNIISCPAFVFLTWLYWTHVCIARNRYPCFSYLMTWSLHVIAKHLKNCSHFSDDGGHVPSPSKVMDVDVKERKSRQKADQPLVVKGGKIHGKSFISRQLSYLSIATLDFRRVFMATICYNHMIMTLISWE